MQIMQEKKQENRKIGWIKKLGAAGFLFFFAKGIMWLILFVLLAMGMVDKTTVEKIKGFFPF